LSEGIESRQGDWRDQEINAAKARRVGWALPTSFSIFAMFDGGQCPPYAVGNFSSNILYISSGYYK